jgi:hypothetical protein
MLKKIYKYDKLNQRFELLLFAQIVSLSSIYRYNIIYIIDGKNNKI